MYSESDNIHCLLEQHEQSERTVSALVADYPDGASTGEHAHARAQLLYAISGVMVVRSVTGHWVVPPTRAVWLQPNVVHEVRMCGPVQMRTVFVASDAHDELPRSSCVVSVGPLLRELIVAACKVPLNYPENSRDDRLMLLLLDELRTTSTLPLHLPLPIHPGIGKVCQLLMEDPGDGQATEQWARLAGMTTRTFQRTFTRETGLTFGQWRQQVRLLAALERLARGERIIDVAFDSGYASQSAFTAMFRRQFGMPPSAFYQ
ncbi:AraC-like DNA-binding protein/quercetin dioxygenase-like cupin family protein [Sphingobium sp. B1D7B]|uniref:AraC family transcriptional regulator n=1 Tax=Sphingobium sp. B1D7B TaxID=2940578 RepID=UPI00222523DD|nr:helix-turn-helix transcriptional regulator [Sphingobium sp. B1D7B]MCW2406082.1 AraC-like DNA-binding protein/quercetin dioxygenase-like cupin family protein [Sphingobium sp. B1D7B]